MSVASLRGQPTLLWFVATWCPSCQAGTPAIAQHFAQLRAAKVRVVEVELYQNLGQPGPTITDFGRKLAGTEYGNPDWTFATSSADLTRAYDPDGSTDVYYLLDADGRIAYVNGAPASTLPDLLAHAVTLS
jgi:thiol-disulfide isomerase/thioredoxin